MEELSEILKNNKIDDITWFCSLSESELDLLISLKKLAIQRAKITCHQELAENFDLKTLRALGLVLMEYVRKRIQDDDTCLNTSVLHKLSLLDESNLLKTNVDDTIDIEEILTEEICNINSKRKALKSEAVETMKSEWRNGDAHHQQKHDMEHEKINVDDCNVTKFRVVSDNVDGNFGKIMYLCTNISKYGGCLANVVVPPPGKVTIGQKTNMRIGFS